MPPAIDFLRHGHAITAAPGLPLTFSIQMFYGFDTAD